MLLPTSAASAFPFFTRSGFFCAEKVRLEFAASTGDSPPTLRVLTVTVPGLNVVEPTLTLGENVALDAVQDASDDVNEYALPL